MILHFVVLSLSFGTAVLSSLGGQGQAQVRTNVHKHAQAVHTYTLLIRSLFFSPLLRCIDQTEEQA